MTTHKHPPPPSAHNEESEYRRQQEASGTCHRGPDRVPELPSVAGTAEARQRDGAVRDHGGEDSRGLPRREARGVLRGPEGAGDAGGGDDSQEAWEEEQILHQQRVWEQVQNERAAARLQSWEDWVMHAEMHSAPRRETTRVRMHVLPPELSKCDAPLPGDPRWYGYGDSPHNRSESLDGGGVAELPLANAC